MKPDESRQYYSDVEENDVYYSNNNNGIALPLVRRVYPQLFANVLVGVQPSSNSKFSSIVKNVHTMLQNNENYIKAEKEKATKKETKIHKKTSEWKLNPAKERKRVYHKR